MGFLEPVQTGYTAFSEGGIIGLVVGIIMFVLGNALAYLLVKTFNFKAQYGRLVAGSIILFFTLLLSLSAESTFRFKQSALFGIGEIIIGMLDVINDRLNSSLPLLVPDPGCQQ